MSFEIGKLFVENQKEPLGIDEKNPGISWTLESDEKNIFQSACQILVEEERRAKNNTDSPGIGSAISEESVQVWNSGKMRTSESLGIVYQGKALKPCTRYRVKVNVWDQKDRLAQAETSFETGFLEKSTECWPGCEWIAAPRQTVYAGARGVFVIEAGFRIAEGSKSAGIVFGANDYRLNHAYLNEYQIEGENYIRYEINLEGGYGRKPVLNIFRVGYAGEDRKDIPFAVVSLDGFLNHEGKPLLDMENRYAEHIMRIEVEGNNASAYLDDILIDSAVSKNPRGKPLYGRTLNPRGNNDVLTYPRLNEIGFYAGPSDTAYFSWLRVRNMRTPAESYIYETAAGGMWGKKSIFSDLADKEKKCFVIRGRQITRNPSNTSIPMFRRLFFVEKEPVRARLYITSRGIYECRVNGKCVTNRLLPPGLTQYDKRLNYQTYDITGLIKEGKNGIGVTLSSGWWSDAQTFTVKNYNYFGDREALLCKLIIYYSDGTESVIGTDRNTWKYFGDGPYTYAGLFCGEVYDARKESIYLDYSKADFDDRDWERPTVYQTVPIQGYDPGFGRYWPDVNKTRPVLEGGYDAPVYIVDRRYAVSRTMLEPGVYLYDFGQEMAGVPKVRLKEAEGTEVILRCAEVLYPDLPRYQGNCGRIMTENYRDATSTDHYICSGNPAGEVYQPKFTFHGYRYLEVSGVTKPPGIDEVESLQYSSVTEFEGSFESSDKLLNRFVENVRWSQLCNFINIPTDCPQRNERMGWAGDTHVFIGAALQNANLKSFYERNIQAMADLQEPDGRYPEIAPIGGGFGGITYECASIFMTYTLYCQYGDVRTIKKFYPYMKNIWNI